jgi:hypothetical protein
MKYVNIQVRHDSSPVVEASICLAPKGSCGGDRVYPKIVYRPSGFASVGSTAPRRVSIFYAEDLSHPGEAKVGTPGPSMYEIGTERGFLPA